jgi:hypothetical protein
MHQNTQHTKRHNTQEAIRQYTWNYTIHKQLHHNTHQTKQRTRNYTIIHNKLDYNIQEATQYINNKLHYDMQHTANITKYRMPPQHTEISVRMLLQRTVTSNNIHGRL